MTNKLQVIALAGIASALWCGGLASAASADSTTVVTQTYSAGSADNIRVMINGDPVDFNGPGPIMVDGSHVMVPIRGVFEQMGGDVQWHPDSQTIEGAKPGHMFRIRVGSTNAVVNGSQTTLPAPPELIGGTTYVPLRFASEALGARVRWNSDTNTVYIHSDDDDSATPTSDNSGGDMDNSGGSVTTTIVRKTITTP